MKRLLAVAAVLTLTACGSETGDPEPRAEEAPRAAKPTAIPVPSGPVRTVYAATVLDEGDGAELCMGAIATSLPPQCEGLALRGWDWGRLAGDYEERGDTRWGSFAVTGTLDGHVLTPTDVVPGREFDNPEYEDAFDFSTPCPAPDDGWRVTDPDLTTEKAKDAAFQLARSMEDYAASWVDLSHNPAYTSDDPFEQERELNDPTQLIINVQVTGDPQPAEATLRDVWGGMLCVTQAEHTERELLGIQDQLNELPGALSVYTPRNQVDAQFVYDDGSIQAWADQEYGEGVVRVTSALVPAE